MGRVNQVGMRTVSFGLVVLLFAWSGAALAQVLKSEPTFEVIIDENVMVPMSDGTLMAVDVYRPDAEGKFPTLLERTPYNKSNFVGNAYFAERGFVYVESDTRGRFNSKGAFYPFLDDAWLENRDGFDTVNWVAKQPWSNGEVGVAGGSHTGQTAYMIGPTQPEPMKAIFARESASNLRDHWVFRGGAFEHGFITAWTARTFGPNVIEKAYEGAQRDNELAKLASAVADQANGYWNLPLNEYPVFKSTPGWQFYYDWVTNAKDGPYWWQQAIELKHNRFEVPVFHLGGWYDIFQDGTIKNFLGIQKNGATELARNNQKLVIGPWVHGPSNVGKTEVGEMMFPGADIYPDGDELSYDTLRRRWFDVWNKGMDTGFTKEPPVLIYVMGDNKWRFEDEWPLARTQYTNYYFGGGQSGTIVSVNDGTLSAKTPQGAQNADSYEYDPLNPIMSNGGNALFIANGPLDQRESNARSLTYTSAVLTEDLEVTGPIKAVLHAMSSAVDTDWVVTLTEVYPDGRSMLIQDGILRARFRGSQTDPTLIEPGKIYEYEVDLWATSNVFKAGNRIRVAVQSSNFPRWDRNLNTAESPETGAKSVVALNTVFRDSVRPSHIVLPVIPR